MQIYKHLVLNMTTEAENAGEAAKIFEAEIMKRVKEAKPSKSLKTDLNGDGKEDEKDASIAGQTLKKFQTTKKTSK